MSDQHVPEPPWLAAWRNGGQAAQPAPARSTVDPGRTTIGTFAPGASGNPAGKVPGTKHRRTVLAEHFDQGIDGIIAVVKELALKGDLQAAGLVLSRVIPPKRAVAERTPFDLPDAPRHVQAQAIVAAVAAGGLDSDAAKVLLECLTAAAGLEKLDLFERQIAELLAKQAERDKKDGARGGVVEVPMSEDQLAAPVFPYYDQD